MNEQIRSHSTLFAECPNCYTLQKHLEIKEAQVHTLQARESDFMFWIQKQGGEETWEYFRGRIEDLEKNQLKLENTIEELKREIQKYERQNYQLSTSHKKQQQQIIELKSQLINEKKQTNPTDDEYLKMKQSTVNDLEQKIEKLSQLVISEQHRHSQEQKFIQSILHMVASCHPEDYFDECPSLKQAWKWLKNVIQEYVQLKKK